MLLSNNLMENFQSQNLRRIRTLCLVTASLTLILIGLGGFVRATGAGLSCPDWPLCFGRVVPDMSAAHGVLQEYVHRVLASLVGLLTIGIAYLSFPQRARYPRLWKVSLFAVGLIIVQGVFGGLTVIMKLNPFIVTGHLLLGTVFFQLLVLIGLESGKRTRGVSDESSQRLAKWLIVLSLLVLVQITLGGFVGASGAALACLSFPMCDSVRRERAA